jgi:hypothetical protein
MIHINIPDINGNKSELVFTHPSCYIGMYNTRVHWIPGLFPGSKAAET